MPTASRYLKKNACLARRPACLARIEFIMIHKLSVGWGRRVGGDAVCGGMEEEGRNKTHHALRETHRILSESGLAN